MALYSRYIRLGTLFNFNTNIYQRNINQKRLSYAVYKEFKSRLKNAYCLEMPNTFFYTSSIYCKRRKSAEERKSVRIIEYSPKAKGDVVDVWKDISLGELAKVLNKDINDIKELFLNQFENPNTRISDIYVLQQAIKRGGKRMRIIGNPTNVSKIKLDKDVYPRPPPKSDLKPRPPVVTVMGHVDHGKTTLLDALRNSRVVDQEFGGITQHIGAFLVNLPSGACITFLDTPGHAAFSAMRARGANLTDIVVLVVAADDGVMEQTVESVRMARQAGVPILVAINKIDSPNADIKRTEQMLADIGVVVENLGGNVQAIPISALKQQNLNQLIEALILQAEMLEIGADPTGPVEAIVIESKIHPHRGKLCTVVVQRGTLKKDDVLVAGTAMGKVRNIRNNENLCLEKVLPGHPAEIEGWRDLPSAGEQVLQVESEKRAREVIKLREEKEEEEQSENDLKAIESKIKEHEKVYKEKLELKRKLGRFRLKNEGPRKPEIQVHDGPPSLNIILKTDVDGSLEAILDILVTYNSTDCKLDLVHYSVGPVSENDVELAEIFNGVIYAFNVDLAPNLKKTTAGLNVPVKFHNIIYKLVDDIKEEINARLPQKEVEEVLGEATVLQQFEITEGRRKHPVAGCRCVNGILKKNAIYKVIRDNKVIHTGTLSSMRHLKNEENIIKTNMECGLQFTDKSINFEKGDKVVCIERKIVTQKTDWDPGF